MVKNKKGFTLIELLAVITVLAIIIVIATTSVGGAITNSRNRSFIETMEVGVKNAKSVLATQGTLDTQKLIDSMDFKNTQYEFIVSDVESEGVKYYVIKLTPTGNSKFNKVDFDKLSDDEKKETMFKYDGKSIIAYIKKDTGKLVDLTGSTPTPDPGDDPTPTPDPGDDPTPTPDPIGEDVGSCKAMQKKKIYNVNDKVSFCVDGGSKEEFFVIGVNHTKGTIDLVTKYALSSTGFQSKDYPKSYKYASTSYITTDINSYISAIQKHISEVSKSEISARMLEGDDVISYLGKDCVEEIGKVYEKHEYYDALQNIYTCSPTGKTYATSWIFMDKEYALDGDISVRGGTWSGYFFETFTPEQIIIKTKEYYIDSGYVRLVVTIPLDIVVAQ